jgi:hypothetical protein
MRLTTHSGITDESDEALEEEEVTQEISLGDQGSGKLWVGETDQYNSLLGEAGKLHSSENLLQLEKQQKKKQEQPELSDEQSK